MVIRALPRLARRDAGPNPSNLKAMAGLIGFEPLGPADNPANLSSRLVGDGKANDYRIAARQRIRGERPDHCGNPDSGRPSRHRFGDPQRTAADGRSRSPVPTGATALRSPRVVRGELASRD